MERALLDKIKTNYKIYEEKIIHEMDDYEYKHIRYNVDFSIAIYAATGKIDFDFIQNDIRKTDSAILLDDAIVSVLFDFVDSEGGLKASENLLTNLEPRMFGKKIFVSVVNSSDVSDKKEHARKLLNLLIYEIENNLEDVAMSD
jgi:hypothetical protein